LQSSTHQHAEPHSTTTIRPLALGLIVTTRNFFPSVLCREARSAVIAAIRAHGVEVIALPENGTRSGGIETHDDARACAELFRKNMDRISGVVVTLPNFGSEKAVADVLRLSGLKVPILIHACPDQNHRMTMGHRRDSFCGKLSTSSALNQYRIPFSLTAKHVVGPETESFGLDLNRFIAVCRVVTKLKQVRFGQIGSRTNDFLTVRYSEKILERHGITVETVDLAEITDAASAIASDDPDLIRKTAALEDYVDTRNVPRTSVEKIARFSQAVDAFVAERDLAGTAIQCWTTLQRTFGIMPCTAMALMGDALIPSACETDIAGLLSMYALQCASGIPSAIVDWNNNYGEERDKMVVFHCSNIPVSLMNEPSAMSFNEIIATSMGKEETYGTISGRLRAGQVTFCRVSTDDLSGRITSYIGQGALTDDPLNTFGGVGVLEVPELDRLMHHVCRNGFEHHVAINTSAVAGAVFEAFTRYLGWGGHWHHAPADAWVYGAQPGGDPCGA
jgi:L-fucose isomerase-like protein